MANQADVRRIALALPEAVESGDRFAFSVLNRGKAKAFAWVWMERLAAKAPRVPNPGVLAVRVANLEEKDALLALDGTKFFTEPHYNGFPAVLVRLAQVEEDELEELLLEAWRCQAPKALLREHEAARAASSDPATLRWRGEWEGLMGTKAALDLRDAAASYFREAELPTPIEWASSLNPVHQRLFAVELADALKEIALTGDDSRLAAALEAWRGTAELDAAPEVQETLRRPKTYRPLSV